MTTIEFADYIDQRTKQQGFMIDDYEKSLLLTLCQEQLIEDLYSNKSSEVFEETERRRRALGNLVYSFEAYRKEEDRPTLSYTIKDSEENDVTEEYKTVTGVNDKVVQSYSFDNNNVIEDSINKNQSVYKKIKTNSVNVTLPEHIMFIVYEQVTFDEDIECIDGNTAVVVPITHDEYYRAMQNPFRRPNERRVFRLDVAHPRNIIESHNRVLRQWQLYKDETNLNKPSYINDREAIDNNVLVSELNKYFLRDDDRPQLIELISKYRIGKYFCRYIKRPNPIIVNELPDYLTIYGFNQRSESEVNPVLHKLIVENAIKMAINNRTK